MSGLDHGYGDEDELSVGDWTECDVCGGEGVDGHECGEDTCACAWPEDNMPCSNCGGEGGWMS